MFAVERTVQLSGKRSGIAPLSSVQVFSQDTIALLFSAGNVTFRIREGDKLLIGRKHPSNKIQPQLDLTEYGGLAAGTSRLHAAIHHLNAGWWLEDVGSSNGTWLDDQRLAPFTKTALTQQNHIMFANLELLVMLSEGTGIR